MQCVNPLQGQGNPNSGFNDNSEDHELTVELDDLNYKYVTVKSTVACGVETWKFNKKFLIKTYVDGN